MALNEDDLVAATIQRWAKDLIDLTRRNTLLYFRHTRLASFEFAQPATAVFEGLSWREGWGFHLPAPVVEGEPPPAERPAKDDHLVVQMQPPRDGPQIERGLKALHWKALAEFLDAGIWVLFVGLGRLDWVDVDGKAASSPLLLVPVRLDKELETWRLLPADEGEPALNPALAVKLQKDFGIELPWLEDIEGGTPADVADAVREAVAATTWTIHDVAVLRTFTFHKEVIYRDLVENQELIERHPMVRLLALGPSSADALDVTFEPEVEDGLDDRHPPEKLACVLDADVSQRRCLLAAREGRSFVMDGPPGTGKSQTITNVIAQLLADGKTVLFVSEKAAALEVVHNRLAQLELDPFVLELHSQKATRKAVAQALGSALKYRPTALTPFDATQRSELERARVQLTQFAIAANEVRTPLGRSVHDVIGAIADLSVEIETPIPAVATVGLGPDDLAALREVANRLGRAWGPVRRGDDFVWRDLRDTASGAARQGDLRRRLAALEQAQLAVVHRVAAVADELHLPAPDGRPGAHDLATLLELVEARPEVGTAWLTASEAELDDAALDGLAVALTELGDLTADLEASAAGWREVEPGVAGAIEASEQRVLAAGCPLSLDDRTVDDLRQRAEILDAAAANLQALEPMAAVLGRAFGTGAVSLELADRLGALGLLSGSATPPEPSWLNPVFKHAVDEARILLEDLLRTYRARRDDLSTTFTEKALELDLRGLRTRFEEVHTGLRKLGSTYRADKRSLAAATTGGKVTDAVIARLGEAIEWQALAERLSVAEGKHASALGHRYWPSRDATDLDEIERAFAIADQALRIAGGDVPQDQLAQQLARGAQPDPQLRTAAEYVQQVIAGLRGSAFVDFLTADPSIGQRPIAEVASWCAALAAALRAHADACHAVVSVLGPATTVGLAGRVGRRAADALGREVRAAAAVERARPMLGPLADSVDGHTMQEALNWVTDVRSHFGGPVPAMTATALLGTRLAAGDLAEPLAVLAKAEAELLGEFEEPYAAELRAELEGRFDVASDLARALGDTVGDLVEWAEFVASRREIAERGWGAVVEALEAARVDATSVGPAIERAVLTRWVDETIDADDRFLPHRAIDRDAVLARFRELDAAVVRSAAAEVINACAARRPKSKIGGAGVINQQAELRQKHKPVRTLLAQASQAAHDLKPCFMMSPLSVSQFLPPTFRFDVVIFDEASQVREADAIGAIYRGGQLIVAGDQKQLPPTDFFSRSLTEEDLPEEDEEDLLDFESVLDRCKAQGVPSLPLNWHYRSRHESLIAFSNYSFYEGRLHTFPGATFDAPDLGVALFQVPGVYRRGGTRDNPIEAEQVVDRIVHHRRHHPDLTLGVVALSVAQQSTIEAAVERRSGTEPELRALVTDDRLDGFFVKNLENVQGDERDIIILSIGYGPDEVGKLTMDFGPMNRAGGARRLNVAVTRARRRVEVVSSLGAGQIVSENPAIRHLARYLDFAQRGTAALALDVGSESRDVDSPFEEDVLRAIRGIGYDAEPQVGVGGYRIDIGVRHPTEPGSFVLGVECDGASYHSSKVARDRDRLRQEVLEGLGWKIHRIWSTAWFTERSAEVTRLAAALDTAIRPPQPQPAATASRSGPKAPPVQVVVEEFDFDGPPDWAYPYAAPSLPLAMLSSFDFTEDRHRTFIAGQIRDLVTAHGPIHRDVAREVVRNSWEIGRIGSKIAQAFDNALSHALADGRIRLDGEFLLVEGTEVRVRIPVEDADGRRVAHVAPSELELAVRLLLQDAGPSARTSLRQAWARLFGWRRTGPDIELAFDRALARLETLGLVDGPDPVRLRSEWRGHAK